MGAETEQRHRLYPLWLAAALLWMGLIFYLSARDADLSASDSGYFEALLLRVLEPLSLKLSENAREQLAFAVVVLVRKAAHMTEYALLGIFLFMAWRPEDVRRRFLTALSLSLLYACSDEIHQLFVPGRSGQFSDVLVDLAGAVIGLLCVRTLTKRRKTGSDEGRRFHIETG